MRECVLVQAYNGSLWVDIAPTTGYPGIIDSYFSYGCLTFNGKPGYNNASGSGTWSNSTFNLSTFKGVTNFKVRFCMASDAASNGSSFVEDSGWTIDNVKIEAPP